MSLTFEKVPPRWLGALVFCATFAAFSPALEGGWLNWDDEANFLVNAHWRGLGPAQLRWAFTAIFGGHYHPLTWLSLGLDHALWGLRPAGYHLTNVLLHSASAVVFFALARRLLPAGSRRDLFSALAALLFSIHPLRAESVAWISERRDVLSGVFYLLTIERWLAGRREQSLAAFLASLLAKAMGVTLPGALLLIEFHRRRKLELSTLIALWPFAALAAAFAAVGFVAEIPNGAAAGLDARSWVQRLAVAAYGFCFYPLKTVLPMGLSHLYPMPIVLDPWAMPYPAALAGAAALLGSAWLLRRRAPAWSAAVAFFALSLAPVCGLLQFGPQLVADRYAYIPCLGFALLPAAAARWPDRRARAAALALAALATALGAASYRQTGFWRSSETLWARAASVDPLNWVAQNYLGTMAQRRRELPEAHGRFQRAIALQPAYAAGHNNLGNLLLAQGNAAAALEHYRIALRLAPGHYAASYNVGSALMALGRTREAVPYFQVEAALFPSPVSLEGLARARRAAGL